MSQRITWRSRPRSEYPWPLRTIQRDRADFFAAQDGEVSGLIGPLPMAAVIEVLFRAKHYRFVAAAEVLQGEDWNPFSQDLTTDTLDPADAGEIIVFQRAAFHFGEAVPQSVRAFAAEGSAWPLYDDPFFPYDAPHKYDIIEDEHGLFWLRGGFGCSAETGESNTIDWSTFDTGGSYQTFQASLVLASGTSAIDAIALPYGGSDVRAASLVITATEWWPYKTTAGLPAWDTATGEAINGGPGA